MSLDRSNLDSKKLVVVGGGISGLAAAHRLTELAPGAQLSLLEASDRLGGVLSTIERDGFLIEQGADSFITNVPWATNLSQRVGLADELITTNSAHRGAAVVRQGRVHRLPDGFQMMATSRVWPLLTSPILSIPGRIRMAAERLVPAREDSSDESLADFACRRLGTEAFTWLVEPMVSGIFTADARRLSVQAAVPQFFEMERRWGSLTRGLRQRSASKSKDNDTTATGARYGLFQTPAHGMSQLVTAVADCLPAGSVKLNYPVERVRSTPDGRWQLETGTNSHPAVVCDGVIMAVSTQVAGPMLQHQLPELCDLLSKIEYASSAVVSLGYRQEQAQRPINYFGVVVPAAENSPILAVSFSSVKFSSRAPVDGLLVRTFVGGALRPELVDLEDRDLRQLVTQELGRLLGMDGEPLVCSIRRWHQAMPQYHIGHLSRVKEIETLISNQRGLEVAGNGYRGVGIPQCIHSGERAAEQLLEQLNVE